MWLVLSLLAVLMFTSQNLLMRVLAIKSNNPRTFSFIYNVWGSLFALIFYVIERPTLTDFTKFSGIKILLIIGAALGYGLYERTHFVARKQLDASTTAVIFRLDPVISFAGAILFLHEPLTITKLLGALVLIGSSLIVIHKNPHLQANRAVFIAVFSAAMLGFAAIFDKPASEGIPVALYSFAMWIFTLPIIAFPQMKLTQLKTEFQVGGWKTALTAFLNVTGFILYLKALSLTDTSLVTPVTSTTGTLTVLAGIFIFKETKYLGRKILAGILMLIGVLLLK